MSGGVRFDVVFRLATSAMLFCFLGSVDVIDKRAFEFRDFHMAMRPAGSCAHWIRNVCARTHHLDLIVRLDVFPQTRSQRCRVEGRLFVSFPFLVASNARPFYERSDQVTTFPNRSSGVDQSGIRKHQNRVRPQRCSTSPPGGNQVDGLPPAPVLRGGRRASWPSRRQRTNVGIFDL